MAIIFVPGIKGSELVDIYPLDYEVRWSLEDMVVGNVFEDPLDFELKEGLYDLSKFHLFREWELINIAYKRLIERLRKWVDKELYAFPYDWRKPMEWNAQRLSDFIDHVRGKLEFKGQKPSVSFITHSMGGLVLRSALGLRKPNPFNGVGRIVFIAPPFRGSCGIPKVLIAGEKNGWLSDEEDFRKLARSFPSVYQLIPSFTDAAVSVRSGRDLDLFDIGNWQENVANKKNFRMRFLINAEAFIRESGATHGGQSSAPMLSDQELLNHASDILVIMSAGYNTVYQIPVDTQNPRNRNWFDFKHSLSDRHGDERVHMKSAAIRGITFAAYKGAKAHATVCRDSTIIKSVSMWLKGKRLVKMKPRRRRNSVRRPGRRYFEPWDGQESSFRRHIVRI